jgi:Beta-galactosidase
MFIHRAPRCARVVVRIALVLASGLLLLPTAGMAEPGQSCAATEDSAPRGLIVVRPVKNLPQQDRALDERALKNPYINGVEFQIHWSDIEPVQGKPDWSKLDDLFAAAESSKKWVHLAIFPGFFAPAWALEGAKSELFAIQYGPGKGTVLSLPMPWDSVYLNRWFAFLKELSERYGKSPAFKMVAAAGPTSVSNEMTLPQTPQDMKKWQNDSYSPRKYIGAWQKVFQVYAADFPNQCVSLSVGYGLRINDQGKIDPRENMRTTQAIIDQAMGLLGRRFLLENNDLHAGPEQHPVTDLVMSYSGRIITGLEMRCAAELGTCSAAMGADGDPPLALKRSIDKGMRRNNAGQHIHYLEIYEPDVLADEMQQVLQYGASLFK